jgi:concanavalin A-like lectin/glucanase superfamily protein/galactose oxidase-like protein
MSLTWFAPAVLAFVQTPSVPGVPLRDPPAPFGYELRLAPGELLLEYAWDGARPVPFLGPDSAVRVPFGERGADANTRLYLPANSELEAALTGATALERTALGAGDGVFGRGLEFGRSSRLWVALPGQAASANGWTLSFWLRPASAAFGRPIVVLPGALEIVLQGDGRARAHLLPSGEQIVHSRLLRAGEWSHLSVCYDPALLRQMRFVVDGTALQVPFGSTQSARVAGELQAGDLARNGNGFAGTLDELALEALPLSTAAAEREARRELLPGSHRLELVTTQGVRTAAPAALPTRELWLDTPADFAGGQLEGVVLANGVLRWVPARWRELETRGAPPPRTTHPTVALGGRRMWIFGGETRDTDLGPMRNTDDTWVLDMGTAGWERVPTSAAPSPRCHVPAAYSPDHDLVLLQGGWKNDVTPTTTYGDTWVYHVAQRRWEQRFPHGIAGPGGSDFGLVYVPSLRQFLLFTSSRALLYDPVADMWTQRPPPTAVTESGQPTTYPFPGSAMCALDPRTDEVVIFGGHYGPTATVFTDKTVIYDIATNRFTVLDPSVRPSARVRSGFAYDPRRGYFVLFGGVQDQYSPRHDDLWIFDRSARRWSELACSNRPTPRGGFYGMGYDAGTDEFVLFAGRGNPTLWFDETQLLSLRPGMPGSALYTFDRVEARNRGSWTADVTTPGSSRVSFFFRWSHAGSQWSPWRPSLARLGTERYVQVAAILVPGSAGEAPSIQRMGLR